MTIQPSPGTDDSSLDDTQRDSDDQNSVQKVKAEHPSTGDDAEASGGQISEAGGASLNAETSAGGADAVPDTHG